MIKKLKIDTTMIAKNICMVWILSKLNVPWYMWIVFLFTIVGFDLKFESK